MVNNETANTIQALTVTNSAVTALTIPAGVTAARVFITVETAAIRFRYDANNPTAGIGGGHPLAANNSITIEGKVNVEGLRMIAQTATDAKVYVTLEVQ